MPERDTFAGAGHRGPDLDTVYGRPKSFGEIIDPVVPVVLVSLAWRMLATLNRDARRLWAMLTWVAYFVGLYAAGYVLRTILMVWRIR